MEEEQGETFVDLMAALMEEYGVNESEIARAIEAHPSTVYKWTSGERGSQQGPRAGTLRKLAAAYPKFPAQRIFAAVGRRAPGPLDPETEQRMVKYFRGLTAEQQETYEIGMKAQYERNQAANKASE